jgi:hypothetical protein
MHTHGNLLHGEAVLIVKRDYLPLTGPQPGERVVKNFVLFAAIAEVKGVVTAVSQKLRVSGLQLQGRACRKDARTAVKSHALDLG